MRCIGDFAKYEDEYQHQHQHQPIKLVAVPLLLD